jgi:hypothetical protein
MCTACQSAHVKRSRLIWTTQRTVADCGVLSFTDAEPRRSTRGSEKLDAIEPERATGLISRRAVCELDDTLHSAGVELCFAEMKDPVKDKLKRLELFERFGERTFFRTLGEAVSAYLASRPVDWVDWEDRTP